MAAPVLIEPGDLATAIIGQQRRLPDWRAPGSKRMAAALTSQHPQYLVRRLRLCEEATHRFQLALVDLPRDLGHGVADEDR